MSTPSESIETTLFRWTTKRGIDVQRSQIGLLSFPIHAELLAEFCLLAPELATVDKPDEVRLLVVDEHTTELSHRDFLRMESVDCFVGRMDGDWLLHYLVNGTVENAFHPMVNPRTGQIEAYECLMRAVLPNGQVKTPTEMISTARAAGVMLHLDRVAQVSAIKNAAKQNIAETVFINFNPSTTCDPEVCLKGTVAAAQAAGIRPSNIVFEVTESECVSDANHLKVVLNYYRSQGFRIALDDLGSGYSSLNLLTELRPDFVKLDMALIRGIDRDIYKQHVTRSLLEMAHCLGVRTVVEGVETEGEWAWATAHGADMIQGYYFARPAFIPPSGPDVGSWSHTPKATLLRSA